MGMKVLVLLCQALFCCIFATIQAHSVQVGLVQEASKALRANVSSCIFCLELYATLEIFVLENNTVADVEKDCKSICRTIEPQVIIACVNH